MPVIAHVIGHIGKDAEIVTTKSNTKFIKFSLATTDRRNGKDETTWFDVAYPSMNCEKLVEFLKKGSHISVIGEETVGTYVNRNQETVITRNLWANHVQFVGGSTRENQEKKDDGVSTMTVEVKKTETPLPTVAATATTSESIDDLPF